jgi:hypothetical protein
LFVYFIVKFSNWTFQILPLDGVVIDPGKFKAGP